MKNVRNISCDEDVVLVWFGLQRQNLASATSDFSVNSWLPSECWAAGYFVRLCDKMPETLKYIN